jgi:hypothetical protein
MIENNPPGAMETLMAWLALAVAWFGGESGRVVVASGMGGLTRWLSSERRRIRDGVLAVIGGAISGVYMWPAVLAVFGALAGPQPETPNNVAMAAFVAGTIGMSFVKIVAAMVEGWLKSREGSNG